MVFIIVLKLNSDRRYKTTDARMMSLHTQKGHGFDGWVTGDKVKGAESLWGDNEPQTWSCNGSSGFSPAAHYTLGRWFVGFSSQKTKKARARFQKGTFSPLLHKAFSFSDGSICKHSEQFSVHYACLSEQFEFNLPAREMLFARLSVISAVLLCLPVYLCVRDRELVL